VKILLVDDNTENLSVLEGLLQNHGYDITLATNGAEALEKARKDQFDVIISEI
jgi:CheY-like chemotaxis protein